jgi:hypothetical protein
MILLAQSMMVPIQPVIAEAQTMMVLAQLMTMLAQLKKLGDCLDRGSNVSEQMAAMVGLGV